MRHISIIKPLRSTVIAISLVSCLLVSCTGNRDSETSEQPHSDPGQAPIAATTTPAPVPLPAPTATQAATLTQNSTSVPSHLPPATPPPHTEPTPEPPSSLSRFQDGVRLEREAPTLASAIEHLAWIQDGIGPAESQAIQNLLSIAVRRASDAATLVFLDWVQDGIDHREAQAIQLLDGSNHPSAVPILIALPWVSDGIDDDTEVDALGLLSGIVTRRFHLASAILSLPWVRDGLTQQESAAVNRLDAIDDMTVATSVLALSWVRDGIGADAEVDAIGMLLAITDIDPSLASSVVALPWVQDGLHGSELQVVARFAAMAGRDLAPAQAMASLRWVQDGIDDDPELTAIEQLSHISYHDAALAKSVISLPWVQDGIHTQNEKETMQHLSLLAGKDPGLAHSVTSLVWMQDSVDTLEAEAIKWLQSITDLNNAWAVFSLGWLQDGIDHEAEVSTIQHFSYISYRDPALAASNITFAWIQDGIDGDADGDTIEHLSHLTNKDTALAHSIASLEWLQDHLDPLEASAINWIQSVTDIETARSIISIGWVRDGIHDETEVDAIQALSYTSSHDTALAQSIVSLDWIKDGIDPLEGEAIKWLSRIAFSGPDIASNALSLNWLRDGIDGDMEVDAVRELYEISYRERDAASALVGMPFLQSIGPPDVAALRALRWLAATDAHEVFQRVVSSPAVSGGLTDELAPVVATLSGLARTNFDLIDALLDPARVSVEMRTIHLPASGEVVLAIVRTSPGPPRSMDLLERSVSAIESMMAAPLPTNFVGLLYQDIVPLRAGGVNSGTHIAIQPRFDVDDGSDDAAEAGHLTAHEVAHYYWTGNADWIDEGMAETMATLVEHERTGYPLEARNWPCPYVRTIAALRALSPGQGADEFACNYSFGERIFLDLLRAHGRERFLAAVRELYAASLAAASLAEESPGTGSAVPLRLEHLRQAFPSDSRATGTIIGRWYHGTEPYDLSHLDLGPSDPALPAINGQVDDAYLSGVDIVGWRHFTLEYSYNISKPRIEVPLEIVERYEDGFVVRHRTFNLPARGRFTEAVQRLYLGPPPSTQDWPAGHYTVHVYEANRQIAGLSYQVTR